MVEDTAHRRAQQQQRTRRSDPERRPPRNDMQRPPRAQRHKERQRAAHTAVSPHIRRRHQLAPLGHS